jgi:hypothetical protein
MISQRTGASGAMEVTLDVFSGRPNPSWRLSAEEERELAELLSDLPPTEERVVGSRLGYRGFYITNLEERPGLPHEIFAANRVVVIRDEGGTNYSSDSAGIEQWLIRQAQQRGYGPLIE